jgi:molybdate/tungstate transport system substrate-binding protein
MGAFPPDRRSFLSFTASLLATATISPVSLLSQEAAALVVASAGAFRGMLEGPLKEAAAQSLHLDLSSHTQGANAVAHSLINGSLIADLFVSITGSPLVSVMQAGKAAVAYPIASTELVLTCSPKSRFSTQWEQVMQGRTNWWEFLQTPGLRIARSNPAEDPSGRAVLFAMMLAARKYKQPELVTKVLGDPINPAQVLTGGNTQALFKSGDIDVIAVYKTGPASTGQPYLALPEDINLSRLNVREENPETSLTLDAKTFYPEPLIFYAATLNNAPNLKGAAAFLALLRGDEGQHILQSHGFSAAGAAAPLRA